MIIVTAARHLAVLANQVSHLLKTNKCALNSICKKLHNARKMLSDLEFL
jgi:hypothetical protein